MVPTVPTEWQDSLKVFIRQHAGEERDHLIASDFQQDVLLRFPDGSTLFFKFGLYLISKDRTQIAVFTEHCGYHVFPFHGVDVELLKSVWTDISER